MQRGCWLGRRIPMGVVWQYVEAAASDVVWRPWSAGGCSVQFGQLGRAALQLGCERWHVGAAAPEGGAGGFRGA